ncbi:hypothetical protein MTO96_026290 [Rhipicephalus appendiculatus]
MRCSFERRQAAAAARSFARETAPLVGLATLILREHSRKGGIRRGGERLPSGRGGSARSRRTLSHSDAVAQGTRLLAGDRGSSGAPAAFCAVAALNARRFLRGRGVRSATPLDRRLERYVEFSLRLSAHKRCAKEVGFLLLHDRN